MTSVAMRRMLLLLLTGSALLPLLLLVIASVGRDWFYPAVWPAAFSGESWRAAFGRDGRLGAALSASVLLALMTGLVAAALGAWLGRQIAATTGWRRMVGAAAAFVPVAAPPIAIATGLHTTLLAAGLGGTFVGVLAGHLVPATGYTTVFFLGVFAVHERGTEDAARTIGASRLQVLRRVTIPMLRRQLLDAVLLGAIVSWGQVALTLLLGGGRVRTLPVEVMDFMLSGQDRFAATGSLLLVIPPLLAFGVLRFALRTAEVVVP